MRTVGIVGSGGMGRWHAERWRRLPVTLAGFYDVDGAAAARLAASYDTQVFDSLEALIAACDVVDVCTPPTAHAAPVIAAAQAGRHVVCEKPIARSLADAKAMIAACDAAGVRLFVAHVVRFFPEFARARELVVGGAVGAPAVVRTVRGGAHPAAPWFSDFALSGGVVLDVAIHDLDYLRWICGDVTRVFARGLTFANIPNTDHALITLRFASGAIGHVEASWAFTPGTFRTFFEIAGPDGIVSHDSLTTEPLSVRFQPGKEPPPSAARPAPASAGDDAYLLELQQFLQCLDTGAAFRVTAHDALEALRLSLATIESIRTGAPVDVVNFEEAL